MDHITTIDDASNVKILQQHKEIQAHLELGVNPVANDKIATFQGTEIGENANSVAAAAPRAEEIRNSQNLNREKGWSF
jgi:hypothetical protein